MLGKTKREKKFYRMSLLDFYAAIKNLFVIRFFFVCLKAITFTIRWGWKKTKKKNEKKRKKDFVTMTLKSSLLFLAQFNFFYLVMSSSLFKENIYFIFASFFLLTCFLLTFLTSNAIKTYLFLFFKTIQVMLS